MQVRRTDLAHDCAYPPVASPAYADNVGAAAEVRRLYEKWQRDKALTIDRRLAKARDLMLDAARARVYLRDAEVGAHARVTGRPKIVNNGTLIFGDLAVLRSIVAPIELFVGPTARMTFGRMVHLNSGVTIAAIERIEFGDRIEVGPHVTIYDNSFHEMYDRTRIPKSKPVVIENDVWLAAKCTILPGVRIGRGAVVAANALVVRNVEPFTVVSGVPAQELTRLDPAKFIVRDP
jgi:acetyltransferase-like isoleucine patch superfamily enzyme